MPLNITIVGLGAVGASLGLALGTLDPHTLESGRPILTGWDRERRAMSDARGRLAVDQVESNLVTAVRQADVVFVTVPYGEIHEVFATIGPVLKNGAIVTDTVATKTRVMQWATELLPITIDFIGGHPLVSIGGSSSREAGIDAFRGSIFCLVPSPRTRRPALDGMDALITAIGAKPYYIDAAEHDSYVAAAGHLPLAASVVLMQTVGLSGGWREIQPIAGSALMDMSEMAGGDPEAGAEALVSNSEALAGWIDRLIDNLIVLRSKLDNQEALEGLLEQTAAVRENWLRSEPNFRPGEDAFYSNVAALERPSFSGLFFGRRPARDKGKRR